MLKEILSPNRIPGLSTLQHTTGDLITTAREVYELFSRERRRALTVTGKRAYVEYRGVARRSLQAFYNAVTATVRAHPEIDGAYVNPFTRRVVFRADGPLPPEEELIAVVRSAEQTVGTGPVDDATDLDRELPDDPQKGLHLMVEAAADAMALFSGTALQFVPGFPKSIGANLYTVLFIISVVPTARQAMEARFGKRRTELILHMGFALALGLAERPLTTLVALVDKVESFRELRARQALWTRWAASLTEHDTPIDLDTLPPRRAVKVTNGPIERYWRRAKVVAACTFAFSLITTRNPMRAIPAAFAALPFPARSGRDLFLTEIGRVFAKRGMLVLSREALRRLDRIDCLVIPADLVSRDQFQVGDAFALDGIRREDALKAARRMFHSEYPLREQRDGDFVLGPLKKICEDIPPDLEAQMRERTRRGSLILGLLHRRRVVALIEVYISTKSSAAQAVEKASRMDMTLVLATDDEDIAETLRDLEVDEVIGLETGLVKGIRDLQQNGRTVCFFGIHPHEGFAVADLGVAMCVEDGVTPWGAHILCPDNARLIETVLDACSQARIVSKQSATMALVSASMGALASTSGHVMSASERVISVMSASSLVAMLNAVRRSLSIGLKRRTSRDPTPWHALEVEGVLARLHTFADGLPEPPMKDIQKAFDWEGVIHLWRAVRLELSNPLTPLLAIGAGVSAVVGSKADAIIVATVGIVNGVIGGYQRFRAERAITALVQTAETRAKVLREGTTQLCLASELRLGDVVLLSQGDVIPADCRIIDAQSLEVDTSPLTGESFPVPKGPEPSFVENVADISSMLYAGNIIAAGYAKAAVVAIGDDTVMARAAHLSLTDEARGGVEARLRELMSLTGPITLAAGVALVVSGMLRGKRVEDLVSTGVSLAVAAVPEGLPVLATAAQLAAAERLSKKGALVKNPRAISALGRVDTLCMDKTGTLTEGRVSLFGVYCGGDLEPVDALSSAARDVLHTAACAVVREKGATVDPMDRAIDRSVKRLFEKGVDLGERLSERAFESRRGFEAVLTRTGDRGIRMFVKGAPELIISNADRANIDGDIKEMSAVRDTLQDEIERRTSEGLRVIAVAEKTIPDAVLSSVDVDALLDDLSGLTFRGLIAFRDPVRPKAGVTILKLARAGVRVIMLTGDHPNTAVNIAKEVELSKGLVLTGAEIADMSDEELDERIQRVSVFARVTPAQKVRIIRSLQRQENVVGMVGDGANDAAAMRAADAGIAVGLESTEAARAAADIVLREANVGELFEAVVEGRAMWRSVRNAVSILVGGNLGEIAFAVAVGALAGRPPLSPRQLLVVNFLTDIAPSTAIAVRPPSITDLRSLKEVGPRAALGSPLNREIVARAITTAIGAWSAWSLARFGGRERASTVGLLGLVGSQLGQTLLSGGRNRSVFWTSLGSVAVLAVMVQTPGLSRALGCKPLGPIGWSIAVMTSLGSTAASPLVEKIVDFTADRWIASKNGTRINRATQRFLKVAKRLLVI